MKLKNIEKFDVAKIRFEPAFGLGPGGVEEVNTAFNLTIWLYVYKA